MLMYIIAALSILASLIVGVLVFRENPRERLHQIYGILTLGLVIVSLANTLSFSVSLDQLFLVRTVMASTIISLMLFLLVVEKIKKQSIVRLHLVVLGVISILLAGFSYTPYIFSSVQAGVPPTPYVEYGAIIYFAVFLALAGVVILKTISGLTSKHHAKQLKYILIGFVPVIILVPFTSFVLPVLYNHTGLLLLSPAYIFFLVACIAYAIIRHGLFDIRSAAVRSVAYVLALATLAGIYFALAYIISTVVFQQDINSGVSASPINVALALVLAFAFQPVKQFFDRITNRVFYRDRYSKDEFHTRFNRVLAGTTNLRSLLARASNEIASTLKAEQAFIYVHRDSKHTSAGTHGHAKLPPADASWLDEQVTASTPPGSVLVRNVLPASVDATAITRFMISYRLSVILPLMKSDVVVGYLFLGEHKVSNYVKRDITTLTSVADELVIAIQNALSIQEVKELNETLQQKIDEATRELRHSNAQLRRLDETKDEFIGMASHQLRTPLTSIKGYLDMILEGDAGETNDMQRKFLTEAFASSERMVHLINDFLNVSRLQTGKFTIEKRSSDLVKIAKQEIENLRLSAAQRGLAFSVHIHDEIPRLMLDEGKIRQVIMNYADNALYYSREDTAIEVDVRVRDNWVEFTVGDTGIGVPESEQSRLFTKFYRAANARKQRPDGTGVGLFLAKRVIDGHGGEIIFESVEGRGSTFGFRLPVKKLAVKE